MAYDRRIVVVARTLIYLGPARHWPAGHRATATSHPATGPAMNANPILLKEGIRTLGTPGRRGSGVCTSPSTRSLCTLAPRSGPTRRIPPPSTRFAPPDADSRDLQATLQGDGWEQPILKLALSSSPCRRSWRAARWRCTTRRSELFTLPAVPSMSVKTF
ncbi:hypothetical protein B0H19DRAFT_570970 [Mycena capillaripes]|nr:hypothetical protein B0H19DRAFT_570970 [Mycena capillaripes]